MHSSVYNYQLCPYFHCNGKIILKYCLELGGPSSWGPLDFAHPTAAPLGTNTIDMHNGAFEA